MRILVTGSEGFLGQHLVSHLEEHGHDVVSYDLSLGDDILDEGQFSDALAGVKICIHLAAVADLYHAEADPELTYRINVDGTRVVLDCCDRAGVRMLYASTCCAYGNNGVSISDEESPVAPTEVYAITKLVGEEFVLASAGQHTVLRLATFYGPQMRSSLATSIFLNAALSGNAIHIHGTGEQTRCFTHVRDICSAIRLVLEDRSVFGIINIADNNEVSISELAEISMKVVGRRVPVIFVNDRDGQIIRSSIDNSLLCALGWSPQWSLEDGLAEIVSHTMEIVQP